MYRIIKVCVYKKVNITVVTSSTSINQETLKERYRGLARVCYVSPFTCRARFS